MNGLKPNSGYYKLPDSDSKRKSMINSVSILSLLVSLLLVGGLTFFRNPELVSDAVNSLRKHGDSCISTLTSSKSPHPEKLFHFSLSRAMDSLTKIQSFPSDYLDTRELHDPIMKQALNVCGDLLAHSIETMSNIIEIQRSSSRNIVCDMKTWLSTIITNQQTCIDTLEEANFVFLDEVIQLMKNATVFTSNSLAIVSEFPDSNIPVLDSVTDFPYWVSSEDRRILLNANPPANVTVAKDGSGNVATIAAAVQLIPPNSASRFVIYVKRGLYVETVRLGSNLWNVMIYGDGSNATIISGSLNFVDGTTTFNSATVAVIGKSFFARDIGFQNSAGAIKHQAVAFRSASDQSVYYRVLFDGFQDTLYTYSNRQFYRECTITGTIDFIFGNSAAVFQNCNILPRQPLQNQYNTITAQGKTDPNQNTGISIQRCVINNLDSLTAATYLGRPWKDYSTTVFMESNLGGFVNGNGWIEWTPGVVPPSTIYYGEYANTGSGSGIGNRVKWTGVHSSLTTVQASGFNVANFINGMSWLPATGVAFDST